MNDILKERRAEAKRNREVYEGAKYDKDESGKRIYTHENYVAQYTFKYDKSVASAKSSKMAQLNNHNFKKNFFTYKKDAEKAGYENIDDMSYYRLYQRVDNPRTGSSRFFPVDEQLDSESYLIDEKTGNLIIAVESRDLTRYKNPGTDKPINDYPYALVRFKYRSSEIMSVYGTSVEYLEDFMLSVSEMKSTDPLLLNEEDRPGISRSLRANIIAHKFVNHMNFRHSEYQIATDSKGRTTLIELKEINESKKKIREREEAEKDER